MVRVHVGPADSWRVADAVRAVEEGGGEVVEAAGEAEAVVWVEPRPGALAGLLDAAPSVRWVQLPFAGVEPFVDTMRARPHLEWTCGKGVYSRPVAEHALAMALAGFRGLASFARRREWSGPRGRNLFGARVTVLGAGGITEELLPLLVPFGCAVTVLRRHPDRPFPAAAATGAAVRASAALAEELPRTDLLVLALALTADTAGVIGARELALLPPHAWIVNVARGGHIDTDSLVDALRSGSIGGAALDVTDPEPLPAGHPLWSLDNALVTPHCGNTPEMGIVLLADRIRDNVRRRVAGEHLLGPVDVELGY